jgi:FtsZ-binding cell division protein ZapB
MAENDWEAEGAGKPHAEAEAQAESQEAASGPGNLTLSANDFSALEQRILRAVDLVRRERLARNLAEERATRAETQMREQLTQVDQLEKDINALRAERDHVRERVERLLGQLDALEL